MNEPSRPLNVDQRLVAGVSDSPAGAAPAGDVPAGEVTLTWMTADSADRFCAAETKFAGVPVGAIDELFGEGNGVRSGNGGGSGMLSGGKAGSGATLTFGGTAKPSIAVPLSLNPSFGPLMIDSPGAK